MHATTLPPHRPPALAPAVLAVERMYPSGASTGWHTHDAGQLLYATNGVMLVHSESGAWVVPPHRALWLIAGLRHNVTMSGAVLMRTAYIRAETVPGLPPQSCVLNVSPLLRELLVAAVQITPAPALSGRDTHLIALLLDEIRAAPAMTLHLPLPRNVRLQAICHALMNRPSDTTSAAAWARTLGVGERTLYRLFTQETGMRFAQWREQARLLHALRGIAEGRKIIDVALDCGYASPSAFTAMFKRHFGATPSSFYL